MVAFPLEVAGVCLYEDGFSVAQVFAPEVIDALSTSTRLATSETPAGKVYAATVQFRDADEGDEQQFEFARTESGFKLVRVGVLKVTCPPHPPEAEPAGVGPASPPSAPPAVQPPAPYAREEYREPSVLVKWFRSNRELIVIIGFVLYEVAAFRAARAAFKRAPRLRRLAFVWAALALVAAGVVGFYLPTQVPGTMWEGLFKAILYVAAGAIVLVVLPVLLASSHAGAAGPRGDSAPRPSDLGPMAPAVR